jgi:hypothetical protein
LLDLLGKHAASSNLQMTEQPEALVHHVHVLLSTC